MSGFARISSLPLATLGVALETWRHPCGALHLHLASDDPHRCFMVGFRTPPDDDTGLPHILEHTTLCGSRRYPVRDPFFKMLRRSLQTFMNAFTFPDLTCYPFATQVERDFDHLLGIYLDAVFRPLLDPRDFAQEGHRLEPEGDGWRRQGVVFNEMKGAMDGTEPQLETALARALLPDTCHRWNSGGEPEAIPALTHADLVAFHRRCYAPANACFATYGAVDVGRLHTALAPYLTEPGAPLPPPTLQSPLRAPATIEVPVPLAEGQEPADAASALMAWTVGDGADLDQVLAAELLDRLLLGHAGAPLRLAIEGSGLGRSAGASGVNHSYRTLVFHAELDGCDPADYGRFPPLVERTLAAAAHLGFPAEEVAAALDQLELARREIGGDQWPFGLELCQRAVLAWNLGAEPAPFLDQGAAIARLRARAADPAWLRDLVRRHLVDNPHRALVLARPDRGLPAARTAAERARTAAAVAAAGADGQAALRAQAAALAERQRAPEDVAVLPTLTLADVPRRRRWAAGDVVDRLHVFPCASNGLLHQLVSIPLPDLAPEELDLLPLLAHAIGGLGVGERDYAQQSALLNARCGGLWAWLDLADDPADGALHASLAIECKGLATRHDAFAGLIAETLAAQRSDETERLAELIDQDLQRLQERLQSNGTRFAVAAASRGLGGAAAFSHRLTGLQRLAWLKDAAARSEGDDGETFLVQLGTRLGALLARLAAQPRVVAVVGDAAGDAAVQAVARAAHGDRLAVDAPATLAAPAPFAVGDSAWTTAAAVGYHALVHRAPALDDADAPALAVAAQWLTHAFLHPRVREQGGAYGGGAQCNPSTRSFACTSFRDPRLTGTLDDFRAGARFLATVADDESALTEAVLAVIAGIDSPASPAGEAKARFLADRRGVDRGRIDAFRAAVLAVTPGDVRRVAHRWLAGPGVAACVASSAMVADAGLAGWQIEAV